MSCTAECAKLVKIDPNIYFSIKNICSFRFKMLLFSLYRIDVSMTSQSVLPSFTYRILVEGDD